MGSLGVVGLRWRPFRALGALGLAALAVGCLGGSPRPEYYRMEPTALVGPPVASLPEAGIALGPIELPRYLDRDEILTRDGAQRMAPADAQRWGGSLSSDVQRVVADDLAALLGTSRVSVYPTVPRFPVDWRVLLDVRSFEGERGGDVELRVRWTVASGATGEAVAVEEATVTQRVESGSWDAYVAAHGAALGVVSRRIAERIAALAAP